MTVPKKGPTSSPNFRIPCPPLTVLVYLFFQLYTRVDTQFTFTYYSSACAAYAGKTITSMRANQPRARREAGQSFSLADDPLRQRILIMGSIGFVTFLTLSPSKFVQKVRSCALLHEYRIK